MERFFFNDISNNSYLQSYGLKYDSNESSNYILLTNGTVKYQGDFYSSYTNTYNGYNCTASGNILINPTISSAMPWGEGLTLIRSSAGYSVIVLGCASTYNTHYTITPAAWAITTEPNYIMTIKPCTTNNGLLSGLTLDFSNHFGVLSWKTKRVDVMCDSDVGGRALQENNTLYQTQDIFEDISSYTFNYVYTVGTSSSSQYTYYINAAYNKNYNELLKGHTYTLYLYALYACNVTYSTTINTTSISINIPQYKKCIISLYRSDSNTYILNTVQ